MTHADYTPIGTAMLDYGAGDPNGGSYAVTAADAVFYFGAVTHRRFKPVTHFLRYRVFSMLINLDAIDALAARLRFFSRGRFNLFSFYDRDYGTQKPGDLARNIRQILSDHDVDGAGQISLLCYPRILGFAFNPLAIYYCHDCDDRPSAILYEVRNTFGGKHSYLIPVHGRPAIIAQSVDKGFHVSPFLDMNLRYHFRLSLPGDNIAVAIRETDPDGAILHAAFAGRRAAVTDRSLIRAFFSYPLMTLKIVAGIHWEGLQLFLKGLRLRPDPPAPDGPITFVTNVDVEMGGANRPSAPPIQTPSREAANAPPPAE